MHLKASPSGFYMLHKNSAEIICIKKIPNVHGIILSRCVDFCYEQKKIYIYIYDVDAEDSGLYIGDNENQLVATLQSVKILRRTNSVRLTISGSTLKKIKSFSRFY